MNLDDHCHGKESFSYAVHDIYLDSDLLQPTLLWGADVVLELKYIGRQPKLFRRMEHDFGLRPAAVEKYVDSVAMIGESLRT